MNFSEKLKELRKNYGFSQEKLAEKLNVSRQAVTKWETSAGYPETETIISIARLFGVTVDELICPETKVGSGHRYLYESRTEYDIDRKKHFDIRVGAARSVFVFCETDEKLKVRLASDGIENIGTDLKVKIDDVKNRTDVDLCRSNLTKTAAQNDLDVFICLPASLSAKTELEAIAKSVELKDVGQIEFDGKAEKIILENVNKAELNCGCDTYIECKTACSVDVNQISCISRIKVPDGGKFKAVKKGIKNRICFEQNGADCTPFDDPEAENVIELNGIKSELIIFKD